MSYAKKRTSGFTVRMIRDLTVMTHPETWNTNILPLRRKNPKAPVGYDLGFLRRDEFMRKWETVLIVYMTNIYTIRGTTDWTNVPQKQYANVEMILKDGWEVD